MQLLDLLEYTPYLQAPPSPLTKAYTPLYYQIAAGSAAGTTPLALGAGIPRNKAAVLDQPAGSSSPRAQGQLPGRPSAAGSTASTPYTVQSSAYPAYGTLLRPPSWPGSSQSAVRTVLQHGQTAAPWPGSRGSCLERVPNPACTGYGSALGHSLAVAPLQGQ